MRCAQVLLGVGVMGLAWLGCMRSSEEVSAAKPGNEAAAQDTAQQEAAQQDTARPAAARPGPVAKPVAQGQNANMNASNTVTTNVNSIEIKGLAGVEHRQADGAFVAYEPKGPVPTPIKAGDRLRLQVEVPDGVRLYAVAAFQQSEFWKLGEWGPANGGVRHPWPDGHVLTADDARMTTLFVVASSEELPWAHALTRENCSALVGGMPPEPPSSACDHLYGLFWKVPKRIRGRVPPKVERLAHGGVALPAIVASHAGAPYTAVEWLFKPRQ